TSEYAGIRSTSSNVRPSCICSLFISKNAVNQKCRKYYEKARNRSAGSASHVIFQNFSGSNHILMHMTVVS
ncbi:hypothetical protein, partial [Vibrio parahaemolyticus]|uniref:hypothetical protein n=1 Tax=Vibrio parahaemolyticus TaxID=670 RepID=UPI001BAE595C